ncbi:aldo/keto reductase [Nocardioides sp. Bht2]|uniref:aldo/keto reductase n=1 Tax=Nocardioides sp. Bht2 TaxID=3392297 RepID=UPI0039B5236D
MTAPLLQMNDGRAIPQLGLGTFGISNEAAPEAIGSAIEAGYRHLDTAQMYGNEAGVGAAVVASDVPRAEFFVTTKLHNPNHLRDDVIRSFEGSLKELGLDYVDLFLIHWPLPTLYDGDFVSTWRALIELADDGRARSIGVSNFAPEHLDRIVAETGVAPVVNQVELNPWFANRQVQQANARHRVLTEAWAPIARGKVADSAEVTAIAERIGATPAQVVLRWHLDQGRIVFPKSADPQRQKQNLAATEIVLTDADRATIDTLDLGPEGRQGPDPLTFDWLG